MIIINKEELLDPYFDFCGWYLEKIGYELEKSNWQHMCEALTEEQGGLTDKEA